MIFKKKNKNWNTKMIFKKKNKNWNTNIGENGEIQVVIFSSENGFIIRYSKEKGVWQRFGSFFKTLELAKDATSVMAANTHAL
jgi:hypothetical protein